MRDPTKAEVDAICVLLADEEEAQALADLCEKRMRRDCRQPIAAQLAVGGAWKTDGRVTGAVEAKQLAVFEDLIQTSQLASAERRAAIAKLRRACGIDFRAQLDPNGGKWMRDGQPVITEPPNGATPKKKAKRGKRARAN
jgi:hypothetical protein